MKKALIGRKVGMTRVYDEKGAMTPVTVVEAGPCYVVQKRTPENDGYSAVQLGFEKVRKPHALPKPMQGHFKKADIEPLNYLKEFRLEDISELEQGSTINVDIFEDGELVDVQGVSIGKGYQGVVRRHGFSGGSMTHGSKLHRATGAVGMCEFPGETPRGKKMPGRMGGRTTTVQRLQVVRVMPEKNVILVKGAVPGNSGGIIYVTDTAKPRT